MADAITAQASLEAALKDEIIRMYDEVAEKPDGEFHFHHGREAAELFEYDPAWLDRAPASAVDSFAGVGNPHLRAGIQPGETVLDLGSGAGLDAFIASWSAGPTGRVIGVDLNPESGFIHVRSAVKPRCRFRQASTQRSAEAYGVKAVMMTAV